MIYMLYEPQNHTKQLSVVSRLLLDYDTKFFLMICVCSFFLGVGIQWLVYLSFDGTSKVLGWLIFVSSVLDGKNLICLPTTQKDNNSS